MIVAAILGVIASIGIPQYRRALHHARIVKCKQDLQTLSHAVDAFAAAENRLPLTLYEVGFGGRLDPWGLPYCFLNYESGTGDGLTWAIDAGLVDPAVLQDTSGPANLVGPSPLAETEAAAPSTPQSAAAVGRGRSPSRGDGDRESPESSRSPVSLEDAPPGAAEAATPTRGRETEGRGSLVAVAARTLSGTDLAAFVRCLDGARTPLYADVPVETTRRRDQYLYPLNTDYDLFSLGPNGRSAAALNDPLSTDDVIRANNGGYFGVAANY